MLSTSILATKFKRLVGKKSKRCSTIEERSFCFYDCVQPVLLCCKLLGFLPFISLFNSKGTVGRFSWKSFYMVVYIPNLIWTTIYMLTRCFDKIRYGLDRNDTSRLIFSVNTLVSSILLLKLSLKWTKTMQKIEKLESLLSYPKNPKPVKVIQWIMIAVISSATVEFLMYLVNVAYLTKNTVGRNGPVYCLRPFFIVAYDWFFHNISFNCGLGIILLISNLQAVYLRNLTDSFVIAVTLYLYSRFAYFNRLLLKEEKKSKRSGWMPWSDLQKYYTRLTHLVLLLDELINPFIFVSFSCNLLFICKQIFKIIRSLQSSNLVTSNESSELSISNFSVNWEPAVYLALSTTLVIIRAALVFLLLAHHHTLTREPLNVLHTVPASVYNRKMQRFMDQIFHSKLSLSGLKFFYVTREFILYMVATLIKYELVLIQFPER